MLECGRVKTEKTKRENLLLSEKPDLIAETESYEDKLRRTRITFRGRFSSKEQALLVDSASSQKINSTLRWLVNNHGTLTGNQAIVVWAIKRPEEKPVLNPQSGSFDFDDSFSSIADESKALHDDISDALNATNVQYAKIFSRVLRGYEGAEDLKKHNDPMVVVILDAATTGRLGVTFYCELQKDEYIKRILQWHVDAAWPLTSFKKSIVEGAERVNVVQYEGAPSFTDIINCACDTSDRSSKSYKRFAKDVKERLIECMFGGAQFPMSILNAACHKVTRPMGYDNIRVWRRDFEIACSLWKKHYIDETRKQHRQEDCCLRIFWNSTMTCFSVRRTVMVKEAIRIAQFGEGRRERRLLMICYPSTNVIDLNSRILREESTVCALLRLFRRLAITSM